MTSTEMEIDASASTAEAGQEEVNILEEPGTSREENNEEKEEIQPVPSTSKALDSKANGDLKNPNVRIVRGAKRLRIDVDSSHSAEKKGL